MDNVQPLLRDVEGKIALLTASAITTVVARPLTPAKGGNCIIATVQHAHMLHLQ